MRAGESATTLVSEPNQSSPEYRLCLAYASRSIAGKWRRPGAGGDNHVEFEGG